MKSLNTCMITKMLLKNYAIGLLMPDKGQQTFGVTNYCVVNLEYEYEISLFPTILRTMWHT